MRRDAHRPDARGVCKRCGLSKHTAKGCPPGFWMTKAEAARWDRMSPVERRAYEARIRTDDVHAIDCDLDEDCTCRGDHEPG